MGPRARPALPFRNYVKLGYSHYTYTNGFPDERDGVIEAAKPMGELTFVGRITPLNRFGLHDTPVSGELYSPLWKRAWGYLGASGAINPGFVPNLTVGGEVSKAWVICRRICRPSSCRSGIGACISSRRALICWSRV